MQQTHKFPVDDKRKTPTEHRKKEKADKTKDWKRCMH